MATTTFSIEMTARISLFQFTSGYQPTVGVDYGFKIHAVGGEDGMY